MTTSLPQLAPHKGLRAEILVRLKQAQPLTAKQLAAQLGVSVNAIRHHLKELEAEQLVVYGREQRGVGAPTFSFRLSAVGEALFPRRYAEALTDLLEHVEAKAGRQAATEMFEEHYRDLTERLQNELNGAGPAERLDAVTRLLSDAGYMAEWDGNDRTFRLLERNCAIQAVAERFPEVCAAEARFLQAVLGAGVERRTHIASGCNACEYAINFGARAPGSESR